MVFLMKRTNYFRSTSLSLGFVAAGVCGVNNASAMDWSNVQYYMSFHTGVGWNAEGEDKTLSYSGREGVDRYRDNSSSETTILNGIGTGFYLDQGSSGKIKLGIAWYGDSEHDYKGYIDQFGDQKLRDFSYKYKLQSDRFVLEGSWSFPFFDQYEGIITGGLGMSRNEISGYKLTTLDPKELSPRPVYKDNDTNSFAWQIGAGVSWDFMNHWQLSASTSLPTMVRQKPKALAITRKNTKRTTLRPIT